MKLVRLGVAVALIALAVPVIAQIRFPDVPADRHMATAANNEHEKRERSG